MTRRELPLGYSLRLAVVKKIAKTFVECEYVGHTGEQRFQCTIPHPYVGKGSGVLVGIERDTIVLVAKGPSERNFIVACVPDRTYNFDQSGIFDTEYDITPFPEIDEGGIVLKSGSLGSSISLSPDGRLSLDSGINFNGADIDLSGQTQSMFTRVNNQYTFTEAGRTINGVIKRNLNDIEAVDETHTVDFLGGIEYDHLLASIGRSPTDETQNRTTSFSRDFIRNPAFVEKRSITYEYADSFGVKDIVSETRACLGIKNTDGIRHLASDLGNREDRRTDILNLNMFNYNHLIEKVEGTVVDIYGNVLDINRNTIEVPDTSTLDTSIQDEKGLRNIYRYLRRSIKYHMEINSRKESDGDNIFDGIGKEHSRWSVDVDGEGLTKINIPSSSDTGNIPVFGRHIQSVSSNPVLRASGSHRDSDLVDQRMLTFGTDGLKISNSEYAPKDTSKNSIKGAGTPYHDLTDVASSIFSSGKFRNTSGSKSDKTTAPIKNRIDNKIGSTDANAGGRSVSANLDGSLELAIGADNIDGKSLVIDLEGGVVSHYGRDNNGRSIIHQTDGDVLIQIGGSGSETSLAKINKNGSLEIHLNRGSDTPQKIIIDSQGMTIDIQGNIVFSSSGDMTLSAGGRLLMAGELNFMYGSHDTDIHGTRAVTGTERWVARNGIPNFF